MLSFEVARVFLTAGKQLVALLITLDCDKLDNFKIEIFLEYINSLESSTKFITEREYSDDGLVKAKYDVTGESKTAYEYNSKTDTVSVITNPDGSKFGYGYDTSGRVTSITQSTAESEASSTSTKALQTRWDEMKKQILGITIL